MKTRFLIIVAFILLGSVSLIHADDCFFVTRHAPCVDSQFMDYLKYLDLEPPFTLAELTWEQASYPIKNGTGFVTAILKEPDLNIHPNHKETANVFVYSDSDSEIHVIELQETENNSGIFERMFGISDSRSAPNVILVQEGDTMGVMYVDTTMPPDHFEADGNLFSTTLIGNRGPPLERVPATNARIADLDGNIVKHPVVGVQVLLQSDIVNQQDHTQKFIWLAHVVNSEKFTVSLSWIDGTLNPESIFSPSSSWIPEREGKYTVTMFVWQSIDNPTALSPPVELEFIVSSDREPLPDDFEFTYSFGVGAKNSYNSKNTVFVTDMVCNDPIVTKVPLTFTEIGIIWESISENNFFQMSDFTENCDNFGNCMGVEPESTITLFATANGIKKICHLQEFLYRNK